MHLLLFGGAFCFHNWDGLVTWALPAEDHVTSALGAQTKWPPGTHGIRIYNMENVFLQGPHGICPNFEIFFVHIAKHTWHLGTEGAQTRSPVGTHIIKNFDTMCAYGRSCFDSKSLLSFGQITTAQLFLPRQLNSITAGLANNLHPSIKIPLLKGFRFLPKKL